VTGARQEVSETLATELARIKAGVELPIMAGFGISTPEQAASVAALADGVVVGQRHCSSSSSKYTGTKLRTELKRFVRELKQAIFPR